MLCESLDIEQTVDSTDKPSPDAWLSIFPELNCLFGTVHGILGLGQSLAPKACLKGFLVGSDVVPESRKVDIVENGELSGPKRRKPLTACRQQGDYSRFKVDNFEVTMGSTDEVGVRVGITGIDLPDGQACLGEGPGHLLKEELSLVVRRRVFVTRSARCLTLHLPRRWPWETQFLHFFAGYKLGDEATATVHAAYSGHRGNQVLPEPVDGQEAVVSLTVPSAVTYTETRPSVD